jgi:hypothetical protein
VTINRAKESMYWDAIGNIFKILKILCKNPLEITLEFRIAEHARNMSIWS